MRVAGPRNQKTPNRGCPTTPKLWFQTCLGAQPGWVPLGGCPRGHSRRDQCRRNIFGGAFIESSARHLSSPETSPVRAGAPNAAQLRLRAGACRTPRIPLSAGFTSSEATFLKQLPYPKVFFPPAAVPCGALRPAPTVPSSPAQTDARRRHHGSRPVRCVSPGSPVPGRCQPAPLPLRPGGGSELLHFPRRVVFFFSLQGYW